MQIGEIFETRVEEKIEPVIKVGERQDERKLASEIGSYVVTPTIEARVPAQAPRRASIVRSLSRLDQCNTQVLAFNINGLADSKMTPLPKLLLSQYYLFKGYGGNLLYARVIEAEIDSRGKLSELHGTVERLFKLANNEVNPNHRDEIKAIAQVVSNASLLTQRVVEVLYMIGELKYIPKTIDNLARLLGEHTTDDLSSIINRIKTELDKLIKATIVAKIGDNYEFLTGERRTFEEEVAEESAGIRWQDLENGLCKFATNDVLGFTNIPFKGAEFPARISFDETIASKDGFIDIRVYSPLAALSTKVPDLENQSLEPNEQKTIFVLCDRIPRFDDQLRYYLAMQTVIDRWKGDSHKSTEAHKSASERESNDLKKLGGNVRAGIRDGLKHAHVIFRGMIAIQLI